MTAPGATSSAGQAQHTILKKRDALLSNGQSRQVHEQPMTQVTRWSAVQLINMVSNL